MIEIQPRVIRVSNAPAYLAMSLPYFNEKVRPYLVEVIDSSRMKCFDRLDLDAWWEQHKQAKGMPAKEKQSWQKEPQVLGSVDVSKRINQWVIAMPLINAGIQMIGCYSWLVTNVNPCRNYD